MLISLLFATFYFRINIYVDDTEVAEGRLKRNFDLLVVRAHGDLRLQVDLVSYLLFYFRINIYVDDTGVTECRLKRNFDLLMEHEDGGLGLQIDLVSYLLCLISESTFMLTTLRLLKVASRETLIC